MGRLIKNHWARLIIMVASAYQVAASLEGFFWPKIFWDFLTTNFDGAVKPVPVLQIMNLIFGLATFAFEWPLRPLAGTVVHTSIEFRLMLFPLFAMAAIVLYQGTNAAIYYLVGEIIYFWAYSDGEVVCEKPWTLPKRKAEPLPSSIA